jgi:Tfp pilus assembly protein PilF
MSARSRKQQIEEMLALAPNDAELRYFLAMEYVSAGQDEEAVRRLEEVVNSEPGYVPAYQQAGQALIRLGRDDEARAMLRAGIAAATRRGDSHAAAEMTGFLDSIS